MSVLKKIIFILFGCVLMSCKSTTNALRPEAVFENTLENSKSIPEVTATSVAEIMSFLASDELEGRAAGEEGIAKAANYIEKVFTSHNVRPYFSAYKDTLSNFTGTAYNIVGFLEGNDPILKNEFIIIGAHYDHIGQGKAVNGDTIANGANDNASGTTAVLELAKYFGHTRTHKRSLLFVLFSAEEKGLLGSSHLAEKLKAKDFNLYTMINFEMIGVPMNASYKAYLTGYEMSNMASKMNEYATKALVGFLPTAKQYQLFKRSDNYPFYTAFKVPCQTISTFDFTNFEYYHHVDDEVAQMDFNHMAAIINDMIPVMKRITSTTTREIKMNE